MTEEHDDEHVFLYYRSPAAIRSEVFTHRMRGLDEAEVREYLALLADQVQTAESELASSRADVDRLRRENAGLRAEVERLRTERTEDPVEQADPVVTELHPQAVAVFRQAQRAADQLVEDAVQRVQEMMASAQLQQREIIRQAQDTADAITREARRSGSGGVPAAATAEVEHARRLAAVAQAQLRSALDVLGEQATRLGQAVAAPVDPLTAVPQSATPISAPRTWQISSSSAGSWSVANE